MELAPQKDRINHACPRCLLSGELCSSQRKKERIFCPDVEIRSDKSIDSPTDVQTVRGESCWLWVLHTEGVDLLEKNAVNVG